MKHGKKAKAGAGKDWILTAILVGALLLGLALLLYPSVSDWWNQRAATRAIAAYDEAVEQASEEDLAALAEAAKAYNERLAAVGSATAIPSPDAVEGDYWSLLDVTGTGIMGYVEIDKIDVRLPIYHGTDAGVLQIAAGHLEGTSLPMGGESTHCVIMAHRGLPSAKLFTDLDQLEEGDTFTLAVLGETLTYRVDKISIVEPDDIEALYVEEGQDYCTLMTCTPYGVNSHRLLVRGVRTDNAEGATVQADARQVDVLVVAAVAAVPMLLVLGAWLLMHVRRRKETEGEES